MQDTTLRDPGSCFETLEPRHFLSAPFATDGLVHTAIPLRRLLAGAGVTAVRNFALFAGGDTFGRDFFDQTTRAVDIYDAATGLWSKAKLSQARDPSATSVGSVALFAGGGLNGGDSRRVDIFHSRTGRWSRARLSQSRSDASSASVGDVAIFAGGNLGFNFGSNVVDIYHDSDGHWSTATLSQPRFGMAVAVVGDKAIFAGGRIPVNLEASQPTDAVDIYDASTGQWSITTLPTAFDEPIETTVGNFALFADESGEGDLVAIYNASTGQWTTAHLSLVRFGLTVATVGNLALFAGGETGPGNPQEDVPTNLVDIFNSDTGQWSTSTMLQPQAYMSSAVIGDKVIFAGGQVRTHRGEVDSNAANIFDASTGQWSTATLAQAAELDLVANTGSSALFSGETPANGASTHIVDLFTTPSLAGALGTPRNGQVSTTLSNTGSSALPAPDSIAVYASASGKLDSNAVLLGSVRVETPLAAGASEQVSVPVSVPSSLPPGSYHVIAAAGPPGQLVEFAARRRLFIVGAAEAADQPPGPAQLKVTELS